MADQVIECASACTVTITHVIDWQAALAVPMTAEQVADYMELWALWVGVGVAVLAAKAIYNHFRIDNHGSGS